MFRMLPWIALAAAPAPAGAQVGAQADSTGRWSLSVAFPAITYPSTDPATSPGIWRMVSGWLNLGLGLGVRWSRSKTLLLIAMTPVGRLSLITALGLAGCGPARAPTCPALADSLDVRLVEYAPSFTACDDQVLFAAAEPLFAIGEPSPELDRIRGASFQSDGGVVVGNGGSAELLLFDRAGRARARVGGAGGGPGEFRELTFLSVGPGDSLYGYDSRTSRVSVFTASGGLARTVTLRGIDTLGDAEQIGVLGTGEIVGSFRRGTTGMGLVRDSLAVVVFNASGAPARRAGVFPHLHVHWGPHPNPGGTGTASFPLPVPFSSLAAMGVRDSSIFVGLADRYALIQLDRGGIRRITRQVEPPPPVTDAHRERLFAVLPGAGPELEILRGLTGPATLPAFGPEALTARYAEPAMLVTDAGGVWLQPFALPDSTAAVWPRFDPTGRYQGTARLPERFRPTAVRGDVVLGVYRDTSDVESVRAYRLMPGRPDR